MSSVTSERFVALLDIMGFRDRVYRSSHAEMYDYIGRLWERIDTHNYVSNIIKFKRASNPDDTTFTLLRPVLFSDTIMFVSNDVSEASFDSIIISSAFLLGAALDLEIPIKGAIAAGTFTADPDRSLYFGRPLVDAHLLAEETHFFGVPLHHTAERYADKYQASGPEHFLMSGRLHFKTGSMTHSYLNPRAVDRIVTANQFDRAINNLRWQMSGSVRRYLENTMQAYSIDPKAL